MRASSLKQGTRGPVTRSSTVPIRQRSPIRAPRDVDARGRQVLAERPRRRGPAGRRRPRTRCPRSRRRRPPARAPPWIGAVGLVVALEVDAAHRDRALDGRLPIADSTMRGRSRARPAARRSRRRRGRSCLQGTAQRVVRALARLLLDQPPPQLPGPRLDRAVAAHVDPGVHTPRAGQLDPVRDLLDRLERLVAELDGVAAVGPSRERASPAPRSARVRRRANRPQAGRLVVLIGRQLGTPPRGSCLAGPHRVGRGLGLRHQHRRRRRSRRGTRRSRSPARRASRRRRPAAAPRAPR